MAKDNTPGTSGKSIGNAGLAKMIEARLHSFADSLAAADYWTDADISVSSITSLATGFLTLFDVFGVSVGVNEEGILLRDPADPDKPVQKALGALGLEDALDRTLFTPGRDFVVLSTTETVLDAKGGDDIVVLSSGGQSGPVLGNSGNDTILGNVGADRIEGGSGADLLVGDAGADSLSGGTGSDRLRGGLADDLLRGGKGDDDLRGDGGLDRLFGDSGNDTLDGGQDADALYGGTGDDRLTGAGGDDSLSGGKGHDTLSGDAGNDELLGRSGDDVLLGGSGQDVLRGTAGNDRLVGGAGADILTGGSGSDWFEFASTDLGGQDRITDLKAADGIRLSGFADLTAAPDFMASLAEAVSITDSGDGHLQLGTLDLLIENINGLDALALEARIISSIDLV